MTSNERHERGEAPGRYGRRDDAINRALAAYRALKQDLDAMGQGKVGTAWHRDRVRQLAILIRSLTRRGLLN